MKEGKKIYRIFEGGNNARTRDAETTTLSTAIS